MLIHSPDPDVVRIDLMDRLPPADGPGSLAASPMFSIPEARMRMEELKRNYDAILASGAIRYPVSYQFVRELGRGRQGSVLLGLRQGARGCVTEHAIKLFDPSIYRTAEEYWTDMGRIASQVSRLQRVQSPNMVMRHTYEETYGIGYIEMEVVDGMDLKGLMSRNLVDFVQGGSTGEERDHFNRTIFRIERGALVLQPGLVVYILRGVLRGLERLHDAGFLHFDVKPANIMIDRLGNVRLIDFGRAVRSGEKLSFLLGSPLYMSPEAHRREPGDERSDLYSLGLVGLEMLAGQHLTERMPASEKELLEFKMKLLDELPSILPQHVVGNEKFFGIMRRFVDPERTRRFSSDKEAEIGSDGLSVVDKQLVRVGLDSEYERDLSDYLAKLVNSRTQRVEIPAGMTGRQSAHSPVSPLLPSSRIGSLSLPFQRRSTRGTIRGRTQPDSDRQCTSRWLPMHAFEYESCGIARTR